MRSIHLIAALVVLAVTQWVYATECVLIGRDLQVMQVNLLSLDANRAVIQDAGNRITEIPTRDLLAMTVADRAPQLPAMGLLELADGQRLPGEAEAVGDDRVEDVLVWRHPWLGRLSVPLAEISAVRFREGVSLPALAEADTVLLMNGDQLEGFVVSLRDPIMLEVGSGDQLRVLEIPRRNVASVRMVTPSQEPSDMRVWLADGTIIDARTIEIDESGRVRLMSAWHREDAVATRLMVVELAAVLLDASELVPMATLQPLRVEGPATRYEVPPPQLVDESAVLGLSSIQYRGPVVVRYMLPPGTTRFAAQAVLPESARAWGDFELVIRDSQGTRFTQHMSAKNPTANINIEFDASPGGSELTIELIAGSHTGIQDFLILRRPMLLVQ